MEAVYHLNFCTNSSNVTSDLKVIDEINGTFYLDHGGEDLAVNPRLIKAVLSLSRVDVADPWAWIFEQWQDNGIPDMGQQVFRVASCLPGDVATELKA